jgi:hypothetical protein
MGGAFNPIGDASDVPLAAVYGDLTNDSQNYGQWIYDNVVNAGGLFDASNDATDFDNGNVLTLPAF